MHRYCEVAKDSYQISLIRMLKFYNFGSNHKQNQHKKSFQSSNLYQSRFLTCKSKIKKVRSQILV